MSSWEDDQTWHAPAGGDVTAPTALCGANTLTEPDNCLRLHSDDTIVTCVKCRELMLQ